MLEDGSQVRVNADNHPKLVMVYYMIHCTDWRAIESRRVCADTQTEFKGSLKHGLDN